MKEEKTFKFKDDEIEKLCSTEISENWKGKKKKNNKKYMSV